MVRGGALVVGDSLGVRHESSSRALGAAVEYLENRDSKLEAGDIFEAVGIQRCVWRPRGANFTLIVS